MFTQQRQGLSDSLAVPTSDMNSITYSAYKLFTKNEYYSSQAYYLINRAYGESFSSYLTDYYGFNLKEAMINHTEINLDIAEFGEQTAYFLSVYLADCMSIISTGKRLFSLWDNELMTSITDMRVLNDFYNELSKCDYTCIQYELLAKSLIFGIRY